MKQTLLEHKMREYTKRQALSFTTEQERYFERYKFLILQRLLKGGCINMQTFARELQKNEVLFLQNQYDDAVSVIVDYNETGGKNLSSGTKRWQWSS